MPKSPQNETGRALLPLLSRIFAIAALISVSFTTSTQTAVANGDTRTIYLFHSHTKEQIAATYRVNGQYDPAVLKQLNWFLRDWRLDEPTNMDPRLFDVIWEAYRGAGGVGREVVVVSAYRSPQTNAMLRRRSRAVAEHSQHMMGKAMDTTMPGMSMEQVREIGMRLQRGGVGYYPSAGTPFVHLDVGSVRSWPRMGYDQLARLFPDGKTVHLPSNGQPLARYEEARAEIAANGGGAYAPPSQSSKGFFAFLFGSGGGEDDEGAAAPPVRTQRGRRTQLAGQTPPRNNMQVAAYSPDFGGNADDSGRNFNLTEAARGTPAAIQRAETSPPRGEAPVSQAPVSQPPVLQDPAAPPKQVAALEPVNQKLAKPEPLPDPAADTASDDDIQADAVAPSPPRRPSDLPAFAASPLPPVRPTSLAALAPRALSAAVSAYAPEPPMRRDPIGALIGDGNGAKPGVSRIGLFAPGAGGLNLRSAAAAKSAAPRADVVSARLDRSNFRAMTGPVPALRMTTQTVQGPSITATRSAALGAATKNTTQLLLGPTVKPSRFGATANALPTTSFAPASAQKRGAGQFVKNAD